MIHHVSISAEDPGRVAGVLAELMDGQVFPFPGRVADGFIAVAGEVHGTMIGVFHAAVRHYPGGADASVQCVRDGQAGAGPFHLLLSVPVSRSRMEEIGKREGWRTRLFNRGSPGGPAEFEVIEFWLESRLLVELTTSQMLSGYIRRVRPENLANGP